MLSCKTRLFEEDGGFSVKYSILESEKGCQVILEKIANGIILEKATTDLFDEFEMAEKMLNLLYDNYVTPVHLKYILKDIEN